MVTETINIVTQFYDGVSGKLKKVRNEIDHWEFS